MIRGHEVCVIDERQFLALLRWRQCRLPRL